MPSAYQLKITLLGFRPPIWRRVLIASDVTFYALHSLIQDAFPYADCHLSGFRQSHLKGRQAYLVQDPAVTAQWSVPDEATLKRMPKWLREQQDKHFDVYTTELAELLNEEHPRIQYTYDYSDNWDHDIVLEKIIKTNELILPAIPGGKRQAPPEDSRGYIDESPAIIKASRTRQGAEWRRLLREWGKQDLDAILEECQEFLEEPFDPSQIEITDPAERLAEWRQWQG